MNDPAFGARMVGAGPVADMLHRRFTLACTRIGLNQETRPRLRTDLFQPPIRAAAARQLDLFG